MKGKQSMTVGHGHHRMEYASTIPLLVSLDDQPQYALAPGRGKFVLRNWGGKVSVDPSDAKTEYRLDVTSRESQYGESVDPTLEVPAIPPPSNYLAKLRQRVRDSMVTTREAFAEQKSIYEVIDDLDEFEEEREARQKRQDVASQEEGKPDTTSPPDSESVSESGEVSE